MTGRIFNIQHFSIHDGPGIRTTVFLKGCNLRCFWCHNPESWAAAVQMQKNAALCIQCGACVAACPRKTAGEIALFSPACNACGACAAVCYAQAITSVGYDITAEDLMTEIVKDRDIFAQSGGGVTFSGGEPLLQPDFLAEILRLCRKENIQTALETAACVPWPVLAPMLPHLGLVFCDIKTLDSALHQKCTGQSNRQILENIRKMSENSVALTLRVPVIPTVNDDFESMAAIAGFIETLPNRHNVELLPFHGLCKGKYDALHIPFPAAHLQTPENLRWAVEIFENRRISAAISV